MIMHSSLSSIHSLVSEIKKEMFFLSDQDIHTNIIVSPSAYDTAWLAMLSDSARSNQPMFKSCLNWILINQNEGGFWGETFADGAPTIDTLPATLSCLIALKTWNVGEENIRKGLAFFNSKAEIILKENCHHLPNWFVIVFPGMVVLAQAKGLDLIVPRGTNSVLSDVLNKKQQILNTVNLQDDWWQYNTPLLSYLECLPPSYHDDQQNILNHLSEDGSLYQSPSATARAHMDTGNSKCLKYLESLVQRCPNGVPAKYPMDEELVMLSLVDHVQRLGLAQRFSEEIDHILKQIYRNTQRNQELQPTETYPLSTKLYKDALGFRLLRMHGFHLYPSSFCWFLQYPDFLEHIEKNYEHHTSVLYAVYRATDLMFNGEFELEESRLFSRKLLTKSMSMMRNIRDDNFLAFQGLQKVIEHELTLPWIARLDHLDHRMWIEETKNNPLWIGNASFYSEKLMQLATENYKSRQSIYAEELEELKRWSMDSGLADIGFGRDKTTYSYFGIAASTCLPHDSIVRSLAAKIAALVTVADDFYDVVGSVTQLEGLTDAVQRWDGKNLTGHSKTIFDALDDLVKQTASSYHHQQGQQGSNFSEEFRNIWKETFLAWMVEKTWSATGYQPSMDDYIDTGMISIAAHTILLPSSCFLGPNLTMENHKPGNYGKITKLFMAIARLLNDTQSYQKEQLDGKMNMVLLHLKENPELSIHDSIGYVRKIVDEKTKELLQIVLTEAGCGDNMTKAFMQLHLSSLKVFFMFFNTMNLFDTKEELMNDIKKAIYIPPHHGTPDTVNIRVKPLVPPSSDPRRKKEMLKTSACFKPMIKYL